MSAAANADESVEVLASALDQASEVLGAVSPDQLSEPTHCGDWTVGDLMAHIVATPGHFITMARGEQPDWSAKPELPSDWTATFRSGADDLLAMWRSNSEASPQSIDWQTAEFAVHTWDLVRATGQDRELDPRVAERGLDFMSASLTEENRGDAFGPAVEVDDDAAVYDRLVAFAGRDPH